MSVHVDVKPPNSLTQRIHGVYDELPAGERKAANLVLDRPGELAVWSASELADRAGISPATVSRFVRRLGYESYEEARRNARDMRAMGSPLYLAQGGAGKQRSGTRFADTLSTEVGLMEASLALLNPLTLDTLAERLAEAPRVRLAGFRNSHVVAEFARIMLAQLRPDVELLNAPGQTLAEGVASVGKGDVVLVFGLRRRPSGFTEYVRTLSESGADLALIADLSIRNAPAWVRWNITCMVETPQLLDSYVGALSVIRLLSIETMRKLDSRARKHLERIEDVHERLGELD